MSDTGEPLLQMRDVTQDYGGLRPLRVKAFELLAPVAEGLAADHEQREDRQQRDGTREEQGECLEQVHARVIGGHAPFLGALGGLGERQRRLVGRVRGRPGVGGDL